MKALWQGNLSLDRFFSVSPALSVVRVYDVANFQRVGT
jgi:hypothetical protein